MVPKCLSRYLNAIGHPMHGLAESGWPGCNGSGGGASAVREWKAIGLPDALIRTFRLGLGDLGSSFHKKMKVLSFEFSVALSVSVSERKSSFRVLKQS